MNTLARLKQYSDYVGITVTEIERTIGVSKGSIARQLKSNKAIGVDKVENILLLYADLNPSWLLTGKGEMLLTGEEKTISEVDDSKKCEELKKEIDLLKQIIEAKNETIKALQNKDSNESSKRQHSA